MRRVSFSIAGYLRRIGGVHPAAAYGFFIALLTIGIANLGLAVVKAAVAPVTGLLQLGDEPRPADKPVQTASAVLEGDEWLQNLKSNFAGRGASRSSRSNLGNSTSQPPVELFSPTDATSEDGGGEGDRPKSSGQSKTYRTMCVRLCDGYYFPISYSTTSDRFDDDERACQRSCSSPAKLYTYRNPGQEPEEMVDIDGRPYNKLINAFLFRTKFDQACKCNAHPWEQEAMARHRKYADDAARAKSPRQAGLDTGSTAKSAKNAKARAKTEQAIAKPVETSRPSGKSAEGTATTPTATSTSSTAKIALLNAANAMPAPSALLPASDPTSKSGSTHTSKAKAKSGTASSTKATSARPRQDAKPTVAAPVVVSAVSGPAPMRLGAANQPRPPMSWQQRALFER